MRNEIKFIVRFKSDRTTSDKLMEHRFRRISNHRNFLIAKKSSVECNGESAAEPRQAAPAGEQVPVARRQLPRLDIHLRPLSSRSSFPRNYPRRGS